MEREMIKEIGHVNVCVVRLFNKGVLGDRNVHVIAFAQQVVNLTGEAKV